jgi:hypothetical protein
MTSAIERDALHEVNRFRALACLPRLSRLRKGKRKLAHNCPIARSLPPGGSAGPMFVNFWLNPGTPARFAAPMAIAKFIYAFDAGKLPHLELQR